MSEVSAFDNHVPDIDCSSASPNFLLREILTRAQADSTVAQAFTEFTNQFPDVLNILFAGPQNEDFQQALANLTKFHASLFPRNTAEDTTKTAESRNLLDLLISDIEAYWANFRALNDGNDEPEDKPYYSRLGIDLKNRDLHSLSLDEARSALKSFRKKFHPDSIRRFFVLSGVPQGAIEQHPIFIRSMKVLQNCEQAFNFLKDTQSRESLHYLIDQNRRRREKIEQEKQRKMNEEEERRNRATASTPNDTAKPGSDSSQRWRWNSAGSSSSSEKARYRPFYSEADFQHARHLRVVELTRDCNALTNVLLNIFYGSAEYRERIYSDDEKSKLVADFIINFYDALSKLHHADSVDHKLELPTEIHLLSLFEQSINSLNIRGIRATLKKGTLIATLSIDIDNPNSGLCLKCGYQGRFGAKYCAKCGASLGLG